MNDDSAEQYAESSRRKQVELAPGESPGPLFKQWLSQLPDRCPYHPEEVLVRDDARTAFMDLGPAMSFGEERSRASRGESLDPQHVRHVYSFQAEFLTCGQCHLAAVGLPPLLQRCSFESFQAGDEELALNLARCRDYAATARGFLFMFGRCGSGKSHLAAAILRARCCPRDRYLRHLDLITRLRAGYGSRRPSTAQEPEVRDDCQQAQLLVIDEIGVAVGGNDAEVLMYDILDYRYTHLQPTVLCSNLLAADFKSLTGVRLTDRFREAQFAILNFNSPSRRADLNSDYLARCASHQ